MDFKLKKVTPQWVPLYFFAIFSNFSALIDSKYSSKSSTNLFVYFVM